MTALKRKKISVSHTVDLSGRTIGEAIELLTNLQKNVSDDLRFEYNWDYDGLSNLTLEGTRDETDEEYEVRIKIHALLAETRNKAEERKKVRLEQKAREEDEAMRQMYEQLKKRFEG